MSGVLVCVLMAVFGLTLAGKIPPYLKPCSRNDPDLNQCAVKSVQAALRTLVKGDPKFGIPQLDPLELAEVSVQHAGTDRGLGIDFSCKDCTIKGLKDFVLEDMKIDLEKNHIKIFGSAPSLEIRGQYSATGKVLVLPIQGHGDADLQLGGLKVNYDVDLTHITAEDGQDHIKPKNARLNVTAETFHIDLTNLFNGDKTLGAQMNAFLNENWQAVLQEFTPAVGKAVDQIIFLIVNAITERVPYDQIFPQ